VERFFGIALVVGVLSPLLWLFAGWLANRLRSLGYRVGGGWRRQKARSRRNLL
jgi:glucose-6-phosphate dehydrogenase assembly protein OpcA